MTVHVYAWDDAGAPVLTGEVGTFAHLLRKCLVDGYGSGAQAKAGAGWEMQWDTGTNARAAFRSQRYGHDAWYYVDDTGTVGSTTPGARHARIWIAEGFGGWDAGAPVLTNVVPTAPQSSFGRTIIKSSVLSSAVVPWILITDGAAVWLFVDSSNRNGFVASSAAGGAYFFGAGCGFDGAPTPALLFCGGSDIEVNVSGAHIATLSANATGKYALRAVGGGGLGVAAAVTPPAFGSSGFSGAASGALPLGANLLADRFWLLIDGIAAGWLPGVRWSSQATTNFTIRQQVVIAGRRYIHCRAVAQSTSNGGCWIDIDGPWFDEVAP